MNTVIVIEGAKLIITPMKNNKLKIVAEKFAFTNDIKEHIIDMSDAGDITIQLPAILIEKDITINEHN